MMGNFFLKSYPHKRCKSFIQLASFQTIIYFFINEFKVKITLLKNNSNLLIIFLLFVLAACQTINNDSKLFQEKIESEIAAIEFDKPSSKYITELYIGLERFLVSGSIVEEKKYHLKTYINFSSHPLVISQNSDLLRENIVANIEYELIQLNPRKLLQKRKFKLRTSHNVIDSPYATHVTKEQDNLNLAEQASEEIYKRLYIYFYDYLKKHENISKKN